MKQVARPVVALALAALIAAGCSSTEETTTTTAAPGASDVPTSVATNDTRSDTSDISTEPDDTPVELTASFRGVTEEVIRVGVAGLDFAGLAESGVETNLGDAVAVYTAAMEAINARGGIGGRQLELTSKSYLPIGGVEAEALCLELTEDREVFVVVGAIRLDNVLCYTENHDTAVIAVSQQNQERLDRSTAPYVTVRGRNDTRSIKFAEAMADAGVFDGETVGLFGAIDADEELYNETLAALRAVGIDPIEGLVAANEGDVAANAADAEIIFERFRAEGVTVTVHASPTAGGISAALEDGYETTWVLNPTIGAGTLITEGIDLADVDGMLSLMPTALGTVDQLAMADDPAVAECVAEIEANSEETIKFELGADEANLSHAINACGMATILELAATAAGPELTNESFGEALAGLGDFSMAGFPSAALGPDDTDAAGAGQLARLSADDEAWEFVG